MLDQQALNLSMVGRKMVPVHRLKNAIINKETEGKFKVNGQHFLSSTPLLFLKDMYEQLQIRMNLGEKYSNEPCVHT